MGKVLTLAALLLFVASTANAFDNLVARVDISRQTMTVYEYGEPSYYWPVSTAGRGYHTPLGSYRPTRMRPMWYSRKYDNSPMPHSIFFRGGYAIHGTNHVRSIGRPVSHGCVRLLPGDARTLYQLVEAYGPRNTRIVLTD